MVSNTIGIATMAYEGEDSSQMKALHYFWGQANDGSPQAVFRTQNKIVSNFLPKDPRGKAGDSRKFVVLKQPPLFWPFSGVAIASLLNHRSGNGAASTQSSSIMNSLLQFGSNDGLGVRSRGGHGNQEISVKAIIIGGLINSISAAESNMLTENALSFQCLASAIFIVNNPHEPPSLWEYTDRIVFPVPPSGHYLWYAD
jgi:hypothetical protein